MSPADAFGDLARYYDPLMSHVNYDRWFTTALALADMLDEEPRHLDAACGTGVLAGMLRAAGWESLGADLSPAMAREARRKHPGMPVAVADLRALPFGPRFNIVTCLFDSLNFLLDEADLAQALRALHAVLEDGGLLYADFITERMVVDHFEGRDWVESNDGFQSRWASTYNKQQRLAESRVQVNTGRITTIRERIYELPRIETLLAEAGFTILGIFDADHWKAPRRKTTRIDIIAARNPAPTTRRRLQKTAKAIRQRT
ncbi:MAG: class I SAM-dependent methyltransferase [Candidatus Hydrogenedentes bacterium]|nr:class I SAM-dependent methyltransferase [Candidatus Hydrogenedentota bacterium]